MQGGGGAARGDRHAARGHWRARRQLLALLPDALALGDARQPLQDARRRGAPAATPPTPDERLLTGSSLFVPRSSPSTWAAWAAPPPSSRSTSCAGCCAPRRTATPAGCNCRRSCVTAPPHQPAWGRPRRRRPAAPARRPQIERWPRSFHRQATRSRSLSRPRTSRRTGTAATKSRCCSPTASSAAAPPPSCCPTAGPTAAARASG